MANYRCPECGNNWNEGPTRDYRADQLCRHCLTHKLKVIHADASRALEAKNASACETAIQTIHLTTAGALGV